MPGPTGPKGDKGDQALVNCAMDLLPVPISLNTSKTSEKIQMKPTPLLKICDRLISVYNREQIGVAVWQ